MAGDKRSKLQREADEEAIARLALFGYSQRKIAQQLGLSPATVNRGLKAARERWRESATQAVDEIKARELAKLDALEVEVLEQWERSKLDATKKVVEDKPGGARGGGGRSARLETAGQCGDPRYIANLLAIMERRAKLLGTDSPAKVAATNIAGDEEATGPVVVALPAQLSPEAWALAFKPS